MDHFSPRLAELFPLSYVSNTLYMYQCLVVLFKKGIIFKT